MSQYLVAPPPPGGIGHWGYLDLDWHTKHYIDVGLCLQVGVLDLFSLIIHLSLFGHSLPLIYLNIFIIVCFDIYSGPSVMRASLGNGNTGRKQGVAARKGLIIHIYNVFQNSGCIRGVAT